MALITWNPLDKGVNVVLSNNNLSCAGSGTYDQRGVRATAGKSDGKWYFEVLYPEQSYQLVGFATSEQTVNLDMSSITPLQHCLFFEPYRGMRFASSNVPHTSSYTNSDGSMNQLIGIAIDLNVGIVTYYKNGVSLGTAFDNFSSLIKPLFPYLGTGTIVHTNFGATRFSIADTNLNEWENLLSQGYLPYDVENATWLTTYKSLVKSNNQLYSLDQDYNFIPVTSPTLENFQTYGLDSLNGLTTPKTKTNYKMNQLGDGISGKTIVPEKWRRSIQGLEVK